MDLDDQLRRYFGTHDLAAIAPGALAAGIERMQVDFGLEQDGRRRFALWAMLHLLGAAPELEVAFNDAAAGHPDILFETEAEARWAATWRAEGIDPALLASVTGRA